MENQLLKKLQIKSGFQVAVLNPPANFNEIIGNIPDDVFVSIASIEKYHAIMIFAITKADLQRILEQEHRKIAEKTICWIIYPKAKTKLASDLNLMQSWDDLKRYHLTPCASAAIDPIWTALRIKPVGTQKKSGMGNAEIKQNQYGDYIDIARKMVTLPDDLKKALESNTVSFNFYQQLSYSNRKEYVLWVLTAKQEKTRMDRIRKTIDKLVMGKKNPSEK